MAGSVVVKDVGALDRFAGQLKKSQSDMLEMAGFLNSAMAAVSESWQDPQREKCAIEIRNIVQAMLLYANAADMQVRYCKKLAAQLRSMS